MADAIVRTTLVIPADLLRATDQAVRDGNARSRNEFIARAIRHELRALERAAIDAAFAGMAHDEEYQAEAREIAESFMLAGWEALQGAEHEPRGDAGCLSLA